MTLTLNIDDREYQHKPTEEEEIRGIQGRMRKPKTITFENFAKAVCHGRSFRQCAASGMGEKDFISACLLAIDIDNKGDHLTIEDAVRIAEESDLHISLMYPSFSDTPEHRRFRMVFALDEPVTDINQFKTMYDYMITLYPNCDTSCRNPAHFFYGTQADPIRIDGEHLNSTADLLQRAEKLQPEAKPAKIRPRKTQPEAVSDPKMSRNIQAIRDHDAKYLRRKLHRQKVIFDNRGEFWDFLYHDIDIAELLGVENAKSFRCIFHDDSNASASIFQSKSGVQLYKCFCPDCIAAKLNVKQLVELLGDFRSEYQALEFAKEIYNVGIRKTAWSEEQQENLTRISNCFNSAGDNGFRQICPTAFRNTRFTCDVFNAVLRIASQHIYPERTAEGNIIFSMSVRQVAKEAGKTSLDKVSKHIKILLYHQMLIVVPDDQVPPGMLAKAIEKTQDGQRHTSFYSLPSWVWQQTQAIERQGVSWREHGYRLNAISYEGFYRAEGAEVATALYPTTSRYTDRNGEVKTKTPTARSDRRSDSIARCIMEQIESRGYATERDTVEILGKRIDGSIPTETQIKRSIEEIMQSYNLRKVRANREIQTKYQMNLPPKSHPVIIIPCD